MPRSSFAHVSTWVFDLDNTLYPPHMRLFPEIERKMTAWVMERLGVSRDEADRLRHHYWRHYGTTLAGLIREHGIEPGDYLSYVHDVDLSPLSPDPELAAMIRDLPGRRIVYTNGDAEYAGRVLAARGLSGIFDAIYGVEHANFRPKPEREAFATVFALDGLQGPEAAMFEDDPRNLAVPHALGMRTVHVAPEPEPADHIQFHAPDLGSFLQRLTRA